MDYLYTTDGRPQGFRLSDYIYALDGTPIGKVFAEKAYRLDGTYVGAVINNMVVDRPDVSRRSLRPCPIPPRASLPQNVGHRRPIGESWPECFQALLPESDPAEPAEAGAGG
jgi:hypothetical protein